MLTGFILVEEVAADWIYLSGPSVAADWIYVNVSKFRSFLHNMFPKRVQLYERTYRSTIHIKIKSKVKKRHKDFLLKFHKKVDTFIHFVTVE